MKAPIDTTTNIVPKNMAGALVMAHFSRPAGCTAQPRC
jgi:hypothetical protein